MSLPDDIAAAAELEAAAAWRIRRLGENPGDRTSAAAAKLLGKLAEDVRQLRDTAVYREYGAILNWLGEFDIREEFAERAQEYRAGIGAEHWPENGSEYLRALIGLARDTAGV